MSQESTKKALENYYKSLLPKEQSLEPKRKNKSPEKDVQTAIMNKMRELGLFVFRVEARALDIGGNLSYSETSSGVSDLLAVSTTGQFLAVEVKASGRRSTLRYSQRVFLTSVIASNGFASVSDSVEHFVSLWQTYQKTPDALKKALLLNDLPREKVDNNPIFEM